MTEQTKPKKPSTQGLDGIHKGGRYVRNKNGSISKVPEPKKDAADKAVAAKETK